MNRKPDSSSTNSHSFGEVGFEDWRRRVEEQLGEGADLRAALGSRIEGIELGALYTALHPRAGVPRLRRELGTREWLTIQPQPPGLDLVALNQRLRDDLAHGVDGFMLTLRSVGDYQEATAGCLEDLTALIATPDAMPLAATGVLRDWLERAEPELDLQLLLLGADPIGVLATHGDLPEPWQVVHDQLAQIVALSQQRGERTRALMVSTAAYREAGAEIDQELGIALATATHYFRMLESAGIELQSLASEMAFTLAAGQSVFLEIAKLRALRQLWRGLLSACGCEGTERPWIHSVVLQRSLTRQDPWNNLVRITAAAWAAILGGVDSLATPIFDGDIDREQRARGARLTRNLQHLLRHEAHLGRVQDPAAGSYALERWTGAYIDAGWARFREIEQQGGIVEALTSGWLQSQIARRWERRRAAIASGEVALAGVGRPDESAPRADLRSEGGDRRRPQNVDSGGIHCPRLPVHRDEDALSTGAGSA